MVFNFYEHKIHYEVHGSGPELLILNGVMMSTASWQPLLPAWTAHFKIILLDFPDQGQSDRHPKPYNQSLMTEVVLALMDHLELSHVNLLGISYGGEVAIQIASQFPEKVSRLLLANTTAWTDPQLKALGDGWILSCEGYDGNKFFLGTMPSIYGKTFFSTHTEWLKDRQAQIASGLKPEWYQGFIRLVRSAETYDSRAALPQISTPTLIIGSEEDQVTPLSEQRYLNAHIPSSQLLILSSCGHASMYEQQAMFEAIVLGWFQRI